MVPSRLRALSLRIWCWRGDAGRRQPADGAAAALGLLRLGRGAGRIVENQDAGERSVLGSRQADGGVGIEGEVGSAALEIDPDLGPRYGCAAIDDQRPVLDDVDPSRQDAAGAVGQRQSTAVDARLERLGAAVDHFVGVGAGADRRRGAGAQGVRQDRTVGGGSRRIVGRFGLHFSAGGACHAGSQDGIFQRNQPDRAARIRLHQAAGRRQQRVRGQPDGGWRRLIEPEQAQGYRAAHLRRGAGAQLYSVFPQQGAGDERVLLFDDDLDRRHRHVDVDRLRHALKHRVDVVVGNRDDSARIRSRQLQLLNRSDRRRVGDRLHLAPCRAGKAVVDHGSHRRHDDRQCYRERRQRTGGFVGDKGCSPPPRSGKR